MIKLGQVISEIAFLIVVLSFCWAAVFIADLGCRHEQEQKR